MRYFVLSLMAAVAIASASAEPVLAQSPPHFVLGFKTLADLIPNEVGQPLDNEQFNPQTGQAIQHTTTGLMVWTKADNVTAFTNGSTTWLLGPYGLQSRPNGTRFPWEPPAPSGTPGSQPAPSTPHPENWSGYAVSNLQTGQNYTMVGGTWTVPQVNAPPGISTGASATWVGIGGSCLDPQCNNVDTTLIQVGTEQDATRRGTSYSAWYEMLPGPSIPITDLTVSPGDKISATVQMVSGNPGELQTWQLSITDETNGQHWSRTVQYGSSLASTDWIVEAPFSRSVLPLADFGTMTFQSTSANGSTPNLTTAESIVMLNPNGQNANVSSANSTGGFNVCWGEGTNLVPCPAP